LTAVRARLAVIELGYAVAPQAVATRFALYVVATIAETRRGSAAEGAAICRLLGVAVTARVAHRSEGFDARRARSGDALARGARIETRRRHGAIAATAAHRPVTVTSGPAAMWSSARHGRAGAGIDVASLTLARAG
jgi:hypothetical protein